MRNPLIPPHAKLVYVYLEGRLNEDGVCWPSHETTANDLGISSASVKRAVSWLKDNDLVNISRRSKGFGTFNIYGLPKRLPDHLRPKDQTDLSVPKDQDKGPKDQNRGDQKVSVIHKEEPLEEQPTEVEPISNPFDEFWKAYPRKKDKGHARKTWDRVVKATDPAVIIAAAVQFRQWCEQDGTEPEFIPYPTTWLNGERWTDERDPAKPTRMDAHIAHIQELWETKTVETPQKQLEG